MALAIMDESVTTPTMSMTRIVHSYVLLDYGDVKILTDPWFSEKPGYYHGEPLGMTISQLPNLSGVIVSHAHYDDYDTKAFSAYKDKSVQFVVKRGTGLQPREAGFTHVTELDPWETTGIGSVKITAAHAKHGILENTYVFQSKGLTVFFGGDTMLIPELAEVAERFPKIDVALLPVNGLVIRPLFNRKLVMDDVEAAKLCGILHPTIAIPTHYAFTTGNLRNRLLLKYTGTAEGFKSQVPKYSPTTTVHILAPGETLSVATSASVLGSSR